MTEGIPFLHQAKEGAVYHISKKGVEAIESWSSNKNIVAFVDGNGGDYTPDDMLLCNSVQLIVASPPKGAYLKWTKQIGHASSVIQLVTKPWTYEDVLFTGSVFALLSRLS